MCGAALGALTAGLPAGAGAQAACGGFDDPCSHDPSQQFAPGNVQRQDTPNDPDYDSAEPDGGGTSTNLYDERFDLFGFPSARTPSARYLDGPHAGRAQVSGFNAAGAWKVTRGDPTVDVAILDTGINWGTAGLRTKVALNQGELPRPQRADGSEASAYDANGDGAFDVDDYAHDPRVGSGEPTGEDLIHAFSDGTDADANGYVDDIAGWDFFDDDNDPADASSYFAAENHGTGRTEEAVERGNDAQGSIGVCPGCRFVPLRVWDTFVSDQNSFAMAITYATDNGVEVIEGADGGLYHSAFAEAATRYAYAHGVAQLYSGDDLNTGNHNFPGAYDHTQLVQGTVPDTVGLGQDIPSDPRDPGIRGQIKRLADAAGWARPPRSARTSAARTRRSSGASRRSRWRDRRARRTPASRRARPPWSSPPRARRASPRSAPTRRASCSSRPPRTCCRPTRRGRARPTRRSPASTRTSATAA